jgi:hypothetical protein
MSQYNPDAQPFDAALSDFPPEGQEADRIAAIDVLRKIDLAKRILLQNRVKNFTAADVVRVAEMIMLRRDAINVMIGASDDWK